MWRPDNYIFSTLSQVDSSVAASHGLARTSKNSVIWNGMFAGFVPKNEVTNLFGRLFSFRIQLTKSQVDLHLQTQWIELYLNHLGRNQ